MRNRTYGGVRGRKTKVGEKLLRFPPTRFLVDMKISLRMPFLVGQAVVVLVDVVFRLALDNQPNT